MDIHSRFHSTIRAGRFPAILLFLLAAGTACTIDRWNRTRVVVKNQDHEVFLEHHVHNGDVVDPGFAHPAQITPLQAARVLRALGYRGPGFLGGKGKEKAVFTNYELLRLAPALSKALAEASPRERVHFISYNMGGGLLFAARQKNEGVAFVQPPGQLNLAFSFVNEEMPTTDDYQDGIYQDYRNPVKITVSSVHLAERYEYRIHRSEREGTVHPLWAVFDMETLARTGPPPSPAGSEAANPPPAPEDTLAREKEKTGVQTGKESMEGEAERIRQKLTLLKSLYEEGLLEKEEYDRIRKELLEKLK